MTSPNRCTTQLSKVLIQFRQAASSTSFWEQMRMALDLIAEALEVECCDIFELRNEPPTAVLKAGRGWDAWIGTLCLEMRPLPANAAQLMETTLANQPMLCSLLHERQLVSHISASISNSQQHFVLTARSTQPSRFSPEEHLFLQAISDILSRCLEQQKAEIASTKLLALEAENRRLSEEIKMLKTVEAVLRESEERYALVANAANDGVWDWNLESNVVYYSDRWKSILGYESYEISYHLNEWFDRIHPDDVMQVQQAIDLHCQGRTARFESEHRLLHKDKSYRWVFSRAVAVRNALGNVLRLTGVQTDITARKQAEDRLIHDALHDSLTGLANRSLFMDRLSHALDIAKRHESYCFAVIFLDLDRFKVINDSLGHLAGDQLLIEVAHRLSRCLRGSDTFARLGGDEFAILLEYVQKEQDVIRLVKRIQQQLRKPLNLNGKEVFINASIGITMSTAAYDRPEELLRDADIAMYQAKASGRGRYEIFTSTMHGHILRLLQLETDLRRAIERQELVVHYQPIVSMRTKKILGFEALLRWQHPERGLISPAEFIPIAEDTGLIVSIGEWVLHQACSQMQAWRIRYPDQSWITISVNISPRQFSQPNLLQQIQQILADTKLEPRYLKLEITESAIMDNPKAAKDVMNQLKDLGIQLSMDDFGTGYSSLSHLHLFPIDTLKIDPSFIKEADTDLEKLEIIRTVTNLAWNLGIDVVAEGVETPKEMTQLRLLRCESAQGYLFSQPLNSSDATKILENSHLDV